METKTLLLLLLNVISMCESQKYKMKLIKTQSTFETMIRENIHPSVIEEMVTHFRQMYESQLKDGKVAPVPLFKFLDSEYYGEILIGKPGQSFKMVLDTTWSFSWVPSVLCPVINIPCAMKNKYNGDQSSLSTNMFQNYNLPYGPSSNLSGLLWKDIFHINQINVTDQMFVAVSHLPWPLMYTRVDGILGLGVENNKLPNGYPIFKNMILQNRIDQPIFSIYFNRDPSSSKAGTIMFGGDEPKHYKEPYTYLSVDTTGGQWSFKMDNLIVGKNNVTVCDKGCTVIAATHTNNIEGPPADIKEINEFIKAVYFGVGRYYVDCGQINTLPPVNLSFNGKQFEIKGKDYIQQISVGPVTVCLSLFSEGSNGKWLLGGAFMSKYYMKFNLDDLTVGIATAVM